MAQPAAGSVALGIDVGTGSTKAGLIDADGQLVGVARAGHPIDEPAPGCSETDPEAWLDSMAAAVAEVRDRWPERPVAAIGMSGQMHGVVVADRDGVALRPAVLWSDQRAQPDLARLGAALAANGLADRLANPVVAGMAGPTLAALARTDPDLVADIEAAVQPKDWVRWQLTGGLATDATDASATLLWDAEADRWSTEAADAFGVSPSWLAPVRSCSEVGGTLTTAWADRLGVAAGTPVAIGAADTAAALLGAGVRVGETQVSVGTGGQIATLVDRYRPDRAGRTHLFRAVSAAPERGSTWYAMAAMQNVGIAIEWARTLLDADWDEIDRVMTAKALPSDDLRFRPSLTGERTPHMDATLTGRWDGLRSGTGRDEIIRSVFDGVAGSMADGLVALRAAGHQIDEAVLAGGGSRSDWWRQLLADSLGIPLWPHDASDASVRGAGLLAWAAVGHRLDPAATVTREDPVMLSDR